MIYGKVEVMKELFHPLLSMYQIALVKSMRVSDFISESVHLLFLL